MLFDSRESRNIGQAQSKHNLVGRKTQNIGPALS